MILAYLDKKITVIFPGVKLGNSTICHVGFPKFDGTANTPIGGYSLNYFNPPPIRVVNNIRGRSSYWIPKFTKKKKQKKQG